MIFATDGENNSGMIDPETGLTIASHTGEGTVAVDYVGRVNRAIDHIVLNLVQPLRLAEGFAGIVYMARESGLTRW